MDPKKADVLQQRIDEIYRYVNSVAITHYLKLLRNCGVKSPVVRDIIIKPQE